MNVTVDKSKSQIDSFNDRSETISGINISGLATPKNF